MNTIHKKSWGLLLLSMLFYGFTRTMHSPRSPFYDHKIDRLCALLSVIKSFEKGDLLVLDVDQVLILRPESLKEEPILMEDKIPEFIRNLQDEGLQIIALTAFQTGLTSDGTKLEDYRINHLWSVDINFLGSSPLLLDRGVVHHLFPKESIPENKDPLTPALVKDGIVFSARYTKGSTLLCFLDALKIQEIIPTRIIIVDDHEFNLMSVGKACKIRGIACVRVLYVGKRDRPPKQKPVISETVCSRQKETVQVDNEKIQLLKKPGKKTDSSCCSCICS